MIKIHHTVNGKEVENLQITPNYDGTYKITYDETFNLINAHHKEIMRRLRKQDIKCQVFKDLHHNYIQILLWDINKAHLTLETLKVPNGCYEINKEEKTITIFLKGNEIKKYRNIIKR